jgi:hypothetical protein
LGKIEANQDQMWRMARLTAMTLGLAEHIGTIMGLWTTVVAPDGNHPHEKSKTAWEDEVNNAIN